MSALARALCTERASTLSSVCDVISQHRLDLWQPIVGSHDIGVVEWPVVANIRSTSDLISELMVDIHWRHVEKNIHVGDTMSIVLLAQTSAGAIQGWLLEDATLRAAEINLTTTSIKSSTWVVREIRQLDS